MVEVKNTVEFIDDCEGMEQMFIESLTFDLIKPIEISGHLGDHETNLIVKMENGDILNWVYEGGEMSPTTENYMTINDGKAIQMNTGDCFQDQMQLHYKEYLRKKLGV